MTKAKAKAKSKAIAKRQEQTLRDRRQVQAFELRLCGNNLRQIKEKCGFDTEAQALVALKREQRRQELVTALHADEERRLDLARADLLLTGVMASAVAGNFDAQKRALEILKYRADLLGLCAPVKSALTAEITGPGGGPVQLQAIVVPGVASIDAWRQAAAAHLARPALAGPDGDA